MNYGDGFSYSKGVMEEAFRSGGILDEPPVRTPKDPALAALKKEDIDLIIHEFDITRTQAEKVLLENGGDVAKALKALVSA